MLPLREDRRYVCSRSTVSGSLLQVNPSSVTWCHLFPAQALHVSTDTWGGLFLLSGPSLALSTPFQWCKWGKCQHYATGSPRRRLFSLIVLVCAKHSETMNTPAWLLPLCRLYVASPLCNPVHLSHVPVHLVILSSSGLEDIWSRLAPFRSIWLLLQQQTIPELCDMPSFLHAAPKVPKTGPSTSTCTWHTELSKCPPGTWLNLRHLVEFSISYHTGVADVVPLSRENRRAILLSVSQSYC